jgi:hypothetical protein
VSLKSGYGSIISKKKEPKLQVSSSVSTIPSKVKPKEVPESSAEREGEKVSARLSEYRLYMEKQKLLLE